MKPRLRFLPGRGFLIVGAGNTTGYFDSVDECLETLPEYAVAKASILQTFDMRDYNPEKTMWTIEGIHGIVPEQLSASNELTGGQCFG